MGAVAVRTHASSISSSPVSNSESVVTQPLDELDLISTEKTVHRYLDFMISEKIIITIKIQYAFCYGLKER